jgi:hypothetical protein
MERRFDERYQTNMAVTVTDMEDQNRVASGVLVNISQSGICADLSLSFAAKAPVKMEIGEHELFGHVTYCTEGQSFRTGIEVVRVLVGKSDLAKLVDAVLAESTPATREVKVTPKQ